MLLTALLTPTCGGLSAQTPEVLLEQARVARDGQDFAGAVSLVERYLEARPGDAGAWWMLGQLRYWRGEATLSIRAYERALTLTPADPWLRVDYARTLTGLGRLARARAVLGAPDAISDPAAREDAERVRVDIAALTAPWAALRATLGHDDQPRTSLELSADVGVFLHPTWTLSLAVNPRRLGGDHASDARVNGVLSTGVTSAGGRWSLRAGGGALLSAQGAHALYALRGSARIAGGVSLWADVTRASYEWTRASLDSVIMSRTLEVALDAGAAPRWAGAAHWQRSRYDDGNVVTSAFGWLLAPIASGVRAGYALAWQDARTSRWERDPAGRPSASPGADTIPGRYAPYYTPERVTTHTLLAELKGRVGDTSLSVRGGYAFHGREQAPVLLREQGTPPGPLTLTSYTRSFSPWNASVALARALSGRTTLQLDGEYRVNTYYRFSRVSVGVNTRR